MPNQWFNKRPLIALAPMADYTDQPFSLLNREISGKAFVVFREMVSAEAIVRGNEKTLRMCEIADRERPVVLQIFGDKPETIARAAKIISDNYKPDGIDINMGCPVPKIAQKSKAGAALMKHPELAEEIVRAVREQNICCPLSVKTRLGWNDENEIITFAPRLEKAGIDVLTVHGRTKLQGFSGNANWKKISDVKALLKIPVIANGDIKDAESAENCLKMSGADGIMIGRAALGNPWIFKSFFGNLKPLTIQEISKAVLRHAELHIKHYGERGLIKLRKHLPWYFQGERLEGLKDIKKIRAKLVRVESMDDLTEVLSSL